MDKIILTPHQNDILNRSLSILDNGNRLVITGKAGTGKNNISKLFT